MLRGVAHGVVRAPEYSQYIIFVPLNLASLCYERNDGPRDHACAELGGAVMRLAIRAASSVHSHHSRT